MFACGSVRKWRAEKLQGQQQQSSTVPPPGRVRAGSCCKPASHYEPSMMIHLPVDLSRPSTGFNTPPLRGRRPSAPRVGGGGARPVNVAAASFGPSSELWSTPSYRPVDSDFIAFTAALSYDDEGLADISSKQSCQRLMHDAGRLCNTISSVLATWPPNASDTEDGTGTEARPLTEENITADGDKPAKLDTLANRLTQSNVDQSLTSSPPKRPSESASVAHGKVLPSHHDPILASPAEDPSGSSTVTDSADSHDLPKRQVSADAAVSNLGAGRASEGPQKSSASESASTRVSVADNDGPSSSVSSANRFSEMTVDSEMLRVSEPADSASSAQLAGLALDVASDNAVTGVQDQGENVIFPSAVKTPSDQKLRKSPLDEVVNVDRQSEDAYPTGAENEDQNNAVEITPFVPIAEDDPARSETGIEQRNTSVECTFEPSAEPNDMITVQSAGETADPTRIAKRIDIAKYIADDVRLEADETSANMSSEAVTAGVEVAGDAADSVGEKTAGSALGEEFFPVADSDSATGLKRTQSEDLAAGYAAVDTADENEEVTTRVQMSSTAAREELWPVAISDSATGLEKTSAEDDRDLQAVYALADAIDILHLDELPSAVDEAFELDAEMISIRVGRSFDSSVVEHGDEAGTEWPPLPSDDDLKISDADLEISDSGEEYKDAEFEEEYEDAEPDVAPAQRDASVDMESGVVTKVGASEKVLTHAARLKDVDNMHRFK